MDYCDVRELQLKGYILNPNTNTKQKRCVVEAKKVDNQHTFDSTKVRAIINRDSCGVAQVVYSYKAVGESGWPSKKNVDELKLMLEDGYVCDNAIDDATGFYTRTSLQCGNYIKSQYYNPEKGLQVKCFDTDDICAVYYDPDEIFLPYEIRQNKDTGGKNIANLQVLL